MFFSLPATVENTLNWFEANAGSKLRVDFSFLDSDNQYLAMGGFTGISAEHSNAEFYVMVNPQLQGQGIGKRVSKWMYNYAFSVLHLNKIYLYTNDDNIAAYKIYENAGFKLEGVLRQHKWKDGSFRNRRFYGLLRVDWEEQGGKNYNNDDL